jgi:hypothetical protein
MAFSQFTIVFAFISSETALLDWILEVLFAHRYEPSMVIESLTVAQSSVSKERISVGACVPSGRGEIEKTDILDRFDVLPSTQ